MLELVHTIFMAKNLAVSIATYFKLAEDIDAKIEKLISKEFNSAIVMLEQVQHISNPAIYSNMLVAIIDRFNQAIALEKRERLLLSYLGLMISYFYLGETNALTHVQQIVSQQKFKYTFWEKHGGEIEEGAMTVLGIAAAVMGGGNAGVGAAMGGREGNALHKSTDKEMEMREQKFNQLRDSIVAITFHIILNNMVQTIFETNSRKEVIKRFLENYSHGYTEFSLQYPENI